MDIQVRLCQEYHVYTNLSVIKNSDEPRGSSMPRMAKSQGPSYCYQLESFRINGKCQ